MTILSRRFSGGALAARSARRAVREELAGQLPEPLLGDVELLVSELATNSVRHAGCDEAGELEIEAEVVEGGVWVRLRDHGNGFDERVPAPPKRGQVGGYGLVLLDRLSDDWGIRRDDGFSVWFEVSGSRPN